VPLMDNYPGMPLDRFVREAPIEEVLRYAGVDGMNLLTTLILRQDLKSASILLDRGYPPDENNWGFVTSALSESAAIGYVEGIKFLLARGADVNGHEHEDMPPLHVALRKGQHEAAQVLLDHGAEVNRIDEGGECALDRTSDPVMIDRLKRAGGRNSPRA
jgi:ankyrin repeat protein